MYLSGSFVCFQVKRKTDLQIPLSSDLPLALWGRTSLTLSSTGFSHSAYPWLPFSLSRERRRDSEANSRGLSYDSSMLIIIFITLYGIPLVVTERHVSFERLGTNQKLQIYRLRYSGFTGSGEIDRCCTALGTSPGLSDGSQHQVGCRLSGAWNAALGILETNVTCVHGKSGCRALAIKKNSTENPGHIKGVLSGYRDSEWKKTKMRSWWGQYYQTPVQDRFLSTSSNISKNSSSQWPSKGSLSQPPFLFTITCKSIYLAGPSLSLGLKQWQNKK